jgi:hypothetical protein
VVRFRRSLASGDIPADYDEHAVIVVPRKHEAAGVRAPLQWVPVPPGRLVLQTLRSHDQYNTTIYGLDDRYRGVKGGRRVVFVNPADIETLGRLQYSTPVGSAAAYYPETNPLVPLDHTAAKSNIPVSKAITARLEPAS